MNWKNIIRNTYIGFVAIFEFIVDILITLITIYILNSFFNESLIITIISYIILVSGLTYGINDIIETYQRNKDAK